MDAFVRRKADLGLGGTVNDRDSNVENNHQVKSKALEMRDSLVDLRQKSMTDFTYYEQHGSKCSSGGGAAGSNFDDNLKQHIEHGNPYIFYQSKYSRNDVRTPATQRTVDSLCVHRLCPAVGLDFKTISIGRVCNGVSCMSFNDSVGSMGSAGDDELLLAVAGLNGIIRVYDFPTHVTGLLSTPVLSDAPQPVHPAYIVESSRDISDLRWVDDRDSVRLSKQFAVSYTYQSVVHIFDLNMHSVSLSPVKTPSRVFDSAVKSVSGGFSALLSFGGGDKLVVGGTSGTLRMWSNRLPVVAVGQAAVARRVVWECPADVVKSASQSVPAVVGLALLERAGGRGLVSLVRSGVLCVWDIEQLTVKSFGSSKTPSLLKRVSLLDICGDIGGGVVGMCPVGDGREHLIAVTQKDGGVVLLDMLAADGAQMLLSKPEACSSNKPLAEVAETAPQLSANHCVAVLPSQSGTISCVGVPGSTQLRFVDHSPPLPLQRPVARPVKMRKVEGVPTLTLPGAVRYAEEGSCEIVVTENLSKYLTSQAVASSSSSLSNLLCLDYSFSDAKHTRTTTHSASVGSLKRHLGPNPSLAPYAVKSVFGNIVTISEPYRGPAVADGFPRVLLRTNLQAACRLPPTAALGDSSDPAGSVVVRKAQRLLREIQLSTPATAVACSRLQPFLVVVGHCDDSLTALSPFVSAMGIGPFERSALL